MNKYAVFHVLDTPYSYGKDKNTLIVRVRVARNDVKECYVYYKDRYYWKNPYKQNFFHITKQRYRSLEIDIDIILNL